MDLSAFQYFPIAFIVITVIVIIFVALKLRKLWRKRQAKKEVAKVEAGASCETVTDEKIYSENFQKWVQGLPTYCISDTPMHTAYRSLLEKFGGVSFQQHVLVDTQGIGDKSFWVIRKGNKFQHAGGTYFHPLISNKAIEYHLMNDCRPLFEQANHVDWRNPEMCADVVTGEINEAYLNAENRMEDKFIIIMFMAAAGLAAIGIIMTYTAQTTETQHYNQLWDLINRTRM